MSNRAQLVKTRTMTTSKGDPASYPVATLENGMTGSCLCGSITVTVTQKDLFTPPNGHICHCINCRKITGASSAALLMLPSGNVTLSDPKEYLKTYMDHDTASGNPLPRSFCSNCGSTIGELHRDGPYAWLHLGIFPRIPEPEFEIFVKHRQPWMGPATEKATQHQHREVMEKYK